MKAQKSLLIGILVCIALIPLTKADINFSVQNATDELFRIDSTGSFYLYSLTTCGRLYTDADGLLTCGTESDPIFSAWDNFTGIPTATPSDADTTHLSTADQIYDWVIGLAYSTTAYVDNLIANIGNWTADKGDYSTTAEAGALYASYNYNPFDQSLNTTDDVQFNNVTIDESIDWGNDIEEYANSTCKVLRAGTTYFEVCK